MGAFLLRREDGVGAADGGGLEEVRAPNCLAGEGGQAPGGLTVGAEISSVGAGVSAGAGHGVLSGWGFSLTGSGLNVKP